MEQQASQKERARAGSKAYERELDTQTVTHSDRDTPTQHRHWPHSSDFGPGEGVNGHNLTRITLFRVTMLKPDFLHCFETSFTFV